ncbi:hypothetical protein KQX54_003794 [Cotesia glomerata]|uniref:Uncharacterized protein n=1 Tax=Cotesia glomerata TaxID=32391 RepID=A0AAV7I6Q0_COTGL|nr:hypothetical protein KQX54_003794 [Cotesia glomerata]
MDDLRYNAFLKVYLRVLEKAQIPLKNAARKIHLMAGLRVYTKSTRSCKLQYQTCDKFIKLKAVDLPNDLCMKRKNPDDIVPAPVKALYAQQKTRVFSLLSEMYQQETWKLRYFDDLTCKSVSTFITNKHHFIPFIVFRMSKKNKARRKLRLDVCLPEPEDHAEKETDNVTIAENDGDNEMENTGSNLETLSISLRRMQKNTKKKETSNTKSKNTGKNQKKTKKEKIKKTKTKKIDSIEESTTIQLTTSWMTTLLKNSLFQERLAVSKTMVQSETNDQDMQDKPDHQDVAPQGNSGHVEAVVQCEKNDQDMQDKPDHQDVAPQGDSGEVAVVQSGTNAQDMQDKSNHQYIAPQGDSGHVEAVMQSGTNDQDMQDKPDHQIVKKVQCNLT